jgi:peptidoglycan/LPS O-acetylase OafA/YrhL
MGKVKILPLEGLRGIASLVVFFWHFTLAFYPGLTGYFDPTRGLIGSPFFFILNGKAAVTFFFTLSGFVLTYRFFCDRNSEYIISAALKRYFRLSGPIFITVMLSFLLWKLDFYYYRDAGTITNSPWLSNFGISPFLGESHYSFINACKEGLFLCLLRGDSYFNSNLWIMHLELIGSFISFATALILVKTSKRSSFVLISLFALFFHFYVPYYTCFVLGTLLAFQFSRKSLSLGIVPTVAFTAVAMFLFSFILPRGFYAYWDPGIRVLPARILAIYANTLASVLAIIVVLGNKTLYAILDSTNSNFLGRISFPLYLVHPLIFFSFSSWLVIMDVSSNAVVSTAILFLGTATVTGLVTFLFSQADQSWMRLVNSIANKSRVALPSFK